MTDVEKCKVDIGDWRYIPCGDPVKEDGLCGRHLGARKRAETARKKREQRWAEEAAKRAAKDALYSRNADLCRQLRDLGVTARPTFDGVVIADGVDLIDRLTRLEGLIR